MNVKIISKLFFFVTIMVGLLFALSAYSAEQTNANLVGGCARCENNSVSTNCPSPCPEEWIAAQGSGDNYVIDHTFCTTLTDCSKDTKVESTYCSTSPP